MIPKTKGYECIVKIAESALDGDTKKAKHYIKKYMVMYPDSDLIYPFTHLLAGEKNPDKLTISNSDGNYSPIAKLVWSYLKYTECDINGEHTTLIESRNVWEMIKALELHIHDELTKLKKLARIFNDDDEKVEQPKEVKSAEQLFNAYRSEIKIGTDATLLCLTKGDAIKCIEEYANQFKQPAISVPDEVRINRNPDKHFEEGNVVTDGVFTYKLTFVDNSGWVCKGYIFAPFSNTTILYSLNYENIDLINERKEK